MSVVRQIALIALGAIVIVAAVIVWKYSTGAMTSLVENHLVHDNRESGSLPISRLPALLDLDGHWDHELAHPGVDHIVHELDRAAQTFGWTRLDLIRRCIRRDLNFVLAVELPTLQAASLKAAEEHQTWVRTVREI